MAKQKGIARSGEKRGPEGVYLKELADSGEKRFNAVAKKKRIRVSRRKGDSSVGEGGEGRLSPKRSNNVQWEAGNVTTSSLTTGAKGQWVNLPLNRGENYCKEKAKKMRGG